MYRLYTRVSQTLGIGSTDEGQCNSTVSGSSQASTLDVNSCKRSFSQTLSNQRPYSIHEVLQQQNSTDAPSTYESIPSNISNRQIKSQLNVSASNTHDIHVTRTSLALNAMKVI